MKEDWDSKTKSASPEKSGNLGKSRVEHLRYRRWGMKRERNSPNLSEIRYVRRSWLVPAWH